MATPETSATMPSTVRPAKAAPKPPVTRKTKKPSVAPVVILSVVGAIGIHILFCLMLANLADSVRWHPFGIDSDVRFGEAQFFVNPVLSFLPFDILFGFAIATVIGFVIRLPFFRDRVHHTVLDIKKRLMLQLSASTEEVESILRNDPENNARLLARRDDINLDSVQAEINAINSAQAYLAGKGSWTSGMNTYMRFHFTEEYSNRVTGLAYGGAAFLIFVVGIRGLKFIPATKPSFILFALGIEFSMLVLLATTMIFTEEEERTDRILKQMVDAVKGGRKHNALPEPEPEPQLQLTRGDYERIVREQMDKKILEVMSDKDDDALRRIALDLVTKG
ncbi:MAG TPA: hypothetical protein VG537_09305 [Candidatus Kapabacteria bacterium]|jgi:hypothetical protein|nr:hypothetical protein [Candidatus Kapabacteria bacterium]